MTSSNKLFVKKSDDKGAELAQDRADTVIALLAERANEARKQFSADPVLSLSKKDRVNLMNEMMLASYISGRIKENKSGDYEKFINDGYQHISNFNKGMKIEEIKKNLSTITNGLIEITRQLSPK
jgi:hypothetical protein